MYSFDLIYVQAWSRPYIRSFDLIYIVQVDLISLTLDLIYQILTIYLKTGFCPIWRVILDPCYLEKLTNSELILNYGTHKPEC